LAFGEGLTGAWSWRIAEGSDCKHSGDLNLIKGAAGGGQTAPTSQAGIAGKAGPEMGVSVIPSPQEESNRMGLVAVLGRWANGASGAKASHRRN
jgi:hypothetical protein